MCIFVFFVQLKLVSFNPSIAEYKWSRTETAMHEVILQELHYFSEIIFNRLVHFSYKDKSTNVTALCIILLWMICWIFFTVHNIEYII